MHKTNGVNLTKIMKIDSGILLLRNYHVVENQRCNWEGEKWEKSSKGEKIKKKR